MADWEIYKRTVVKNDLKSQNLERLRTMESWLQLPFEQCASIALETFKGKDQDSLRPWYQLSRALYLKLLRDAGFELADAAQREHDLNLICQSGKATPEQARTAAALYNIGQISAALTTLYPAIAQLTAGELAGNVTREKIGPICDRLSGLNVTPAFVNAATIQALHEILGEFQQIVAETQKDNPGHLDALYFCGATADALGAASANSGDNASALEWYAKSSAFFEQANNSDKAEEPRKAAARLELQLTGDIDRSTQRILGPLYQPGRSTDPLAAAMAYAEMVQIMNSAGDGFGAGEVAERAVAAFQSLGFEDPAATNPEQALDSWVSRVCELASGRRVYALLMGVCSSFAAVFSGRVAKYAASDPKKAKDNEKLTPAMQAITSRIRAETQAAEDELAAAIAPYLPKPLPAMESGPDEAAMALKQQQMQFVDEALLQVCQFADQLAAAGQPVELAMHQLQQLKPMADELHMPLYDAKWKLAVAYVHMAGGETQKALDSAEDAITLLLCGKPPRLSSLAQTYERTIYLEALELKTRSQMMLGQLKAGMETCMEAIADFEQSRSRVNAPLQQSTLLKSVAGFYRDAAFAAFKLKDWNALLRVTELVKARSAIRNRLNADSAVPDAVALEKQFEQITAEIQDEGNSSDVGKLAELRARRRDVSDLLAIARAQAAGMAKLPEPSVETLQQLLAEDEAAVGYFFLVPTVLLIMLIDRKRFEVERIVFKSDKEMAPVNELLAAIAGLDSSGSLDLDDAIAAAGDLLLPPVVREFLKGKARVIISPHHGLHLFPFHAARWEGQFFIERSAIRYVPNFSSLLLAWRGQIKTGVFAIGVSQFSVRGQQWPELTNTEEQVREVAGIYAGLKLKAQTLTGKSASTEALRRAAREGGLNCYSVLHLATHGTSVLAPDTENEPMESKLVLADGYLDGLELATFRLPAHVAVLSACNSGQRAVGGRGMSELPGDDIFGLQSALFQAGVHTVLGSLWPVQTDAAFKATLDFHTYYAQGEAPEIALKKALLSHIRSGLGTVLWAPFFLSSFGSAPAM